MQTQLLSIVVLRSRRMATNVGAVTANHRPAPLPTNDAQPTPLIRTLYLCILQGRGVAAGQTT